MQTAFHTRPKEKNSHLRANPQLPLLTTPHPTPQTRVPCTLSLLRSLGLWLAGILPASKEKNSHLRASPQWLFLFFWDAQDLVVQVLSDLGIFHVISGVPLASSIYICYFLTICCHGQKVDYCCTHCYRSLSDCTIQSSVLNSFFDNGTRVKG